MSDNLTRLARVLGMMGSAHDGEVLNAARMAEKIRREMDKTWQTILTPSGSTSSHDDMMRVMRAESRAIAAERRATEAERRNLELDQRVRALEATIRSMSSGGQAPPHPGASAYSYRTRTRRASVPPLSAQAEAELVRRLTMRTYFGVTAKEIWAITDWPRPMNLKSKLPPIAAKYGKRAEQVSRGRWRFVDIS